MKLTDDQIEHIAEVYHQAVDDFIQRKNRIYGNWSPSLIPKNAFRPAPHDWIPAVANAVLEIFENKP